MSGLKLKWDASGGKTIYEGALVLVRFIWSQNVLTRLFSLFSLWSDWLSSSAIFSEDDEDFLQSLPLPNSHASAKGKKKNRKNRKKLEKQ
jgi:hypothetical protein